MDPTLVIDRCGGLASAMELRIAGVSRRALTSALEARRIIRVRQRWYARARVDDRMIRAARVGGRATAASALSLLEVWVPDHRLHVAVPPNACELRDPDDKRRRLHERADVCIHWVDRRGDETSRLRRDPLDALRDLADCATSAEVEIAADALLHRRPDLSHDWSGRIQQFRRRLRRLLERVDGVCESGSETRFWVQMRDRCHLLRQVRISGVGRVDFLIGRRLVIEIDGAEYHMDRKRFERDRRRDALLSRLGYRVLRFSYHQVMNDWPLVEAAVGAAIARGDHL